MSVSKVYEKPVVEALGSIEERTQAGSNPLADSVPQVANTAFGLPS